MSRYCIILKQVADSEAIVCENGWPMIFPSKDKADDFGRKNVKGKLTVWWKSIKESEARKFYKFKN